MARRAAQEMQDGYYVNLGIGIRRCLQLLPEGASVQLQARTACSAWGRSRRGEEDPTHQRRQATITELPTTSYFDSAQSFGMVRGGHIDLSILGASR